MAERQPHTDASKAPADRPGLSAVPLLTYTQREAAAALGCSVAFFRLHVLPDLQIIRRGRRTMIPVRELERWVQANAEPL